MSRISRENSPELTLADVVAHLAKASAPQSIRQIAAGMNLNHWGRRDLPGILRRLERDGEVSRHRSRYSLQSGAGRARPMAPAQERSPRSARRSSVPSEAPTALTPPHPRESRDPNTITGRLLTHRDGYGFVVPAAPIPGVEGDLFIPPHAMSDAMHGDRVLARLEQRHAGGRAEGRILRILERGQATIVGIFHYSSAANTVLPYDTHLQHEIIIPPGQELTAELRDKLGVAAGLEQSMRSVRLPELSGAVVNVEITRFPRSGVAPAGRVVEILGRPGEIGVDTEIMIRKHHLPHVFPDEALAEARLLPRLVAQEEVQTRRDFRQLPIVTIDGESARDFDDAVFVASEALGYQLQVHIADVAHYVHRGSPLDREARLRATSVYFPSRAVPMLPESLSNGICSLNPLVERLVMSVVMHLDHDARILSAEFTPGVIRSVERMTYTSVNQVLEGEAGALARYAPLADHFRLMRELALKLNARRTARGSIDFDLPEPLIQFDELGRMTGVTRSERNIAHRIIEEFMLAANETVARHLDRLSVPSLHRVHEMPDPKRVLEFEQLARTFGYSLGVENLFERKVPIRHARAKPKHHAAYGRTRPMTLLLPADDVVIRPEHYQRLTLKIVGKPEERILSYLMLRSLRQARYSASSLGHFALAAQEYTHFTSPIRRYPDLIVHRSLKWALANVPGADSASFAPENKRESRKRKPHGAHPHALPGVYQRVELEEIAIESSEAERRADGAERELVEWKTAQFMESHLGEEYDALIISVQKFGFFIELSELFVEGLVPIDRLELQTGERILYRESDHALVTARRKRPFRIGDRLRVRAERIDPFRRRVEFALAEDEAPSSGRSAPARGRS